MQRRIIYHIDVNSAFLSWTAAYRTRVLGEDTDLRDIPSAICGDTESRHGIILAKSTPAKKYGITTGEPLHQALAKCPQLVVEKPDYDMYVRASASFIRLVREVAPLVEQYSIDEAWADMSGTAEMYGSPVMTALRLKDRIRDELGFTVNIGISDNKLLAKMAGELQKPDKVITLFPCEIREKLWPLPVRELFMVGPATERKLKMLGMKTIGDIAAADPALLRAHMHSHGELIWNYANGRCDDEVNDECALNKGYGNSTTTPRDILDKETAHGVLLSLSETVGARMRRDGQTGSCIGVSLRTSAFAQLSRQEQLRFSTDSTDEIYAAACALFDRLWDGRTPLRQLGVQITNVSREHFRQRDIFEPDRYEKLAKTDKAVDAIRLRFGIDSLKRARFIGGEERHMSGGLAQSRQTGITKPVECKDE